MTIPQSSSQAGWKAWRVDYERTVSQLWCYPANCAPQVGGRLVFAAAGAAFGTRAVKNPWIAIALTIAGYKLGMYLDEQISRQCPKCGAILRIAGLLP